MAPLQSLPIASCFSSPDDYVSSLLLFSADPLLRTLCGGIHILDFFTRDSSTDGEPQDLYHTVLPPDWIAFFDIKPIEQVLDLLLRTPLESLDSTIPASLCVFIKNTRRHSLQREFIRRDDREKTKRRTGYGTESALNAGMRPKKIHEVENFSAFLDELVLDISSTNRTDVEGRISHVVDIGSGQAYLSRTVAKKYGHNVVGIESRKINIDGAMALDKSFDAIAIRKLRHKEKECFDRFDAVGNSVFNPGSLQYIETYISDGNLDSVVSAIPSPPQSADGTAPQSKSLLLTSLHSCGNLVHHALNAFRNTPSVRAVALIGCCYNLMTEKHGTSFKPPYLRTAHPRLVKTSAAGDPAGFPISSLLTQKNIQLNITARSMACQAPSNWTEESSADFFLRHFYRALLQRVFLDRGILVPDTGDPIIIGSLRKHSYENFYSYVTAAVKKLGWEERLKIDIDEAEAYVRRFGPRKKELSVVWSLMAFSAAVIESLIVVDRWQFLMEMGCSRTWVEAAFEYSESPRNLVVVGIR